MFSHFIGHIYLFHEPPAAELPLVDFPIFSQTDDAPEKLLINVDIEDLNESSKLKLKKYFEQNILSQETLKKNSYIDLEKQLKLANFIQNKLKDISRFMKWEQYPTNDQLKVSCMLIWDYFVSSNKRIYGVSSGKQLHFRLNQFREARHSLHEALCPSSARALVPRHEGCQGGENHLAPDLDGTCRGAGAVLRQLVGAVPAASGGGGCGSLHRFNGGGLCLPAHGGHMDEPSFAYQPHGRRVQCRERELHAGNPPHGERVFRQSAHTFLLQEEVEQWLYQCGKPVPCHHRTGYAGQRKILCRGEQLYQTAD